MQGLVLAGDIGGTKTDLALYVQEKRLRCLRTQRYVNAEFASFPEVLRAFISDELVELACFGIAGPIQGNRARTTNLPWMIDANELARVLDVEHVALINDLEANAHGIEELAPEELCVLNEGGGQKDANRALIAAGTGLGEAGIYWDGSRYFPFATEGGHVDFAPRDEQEIELWRYLRAKFKHVSYERILSGSGLSHLYSFLIEKGLEREMESVRQQLGREDAAKVIVEHAIRGECAASSRALAWFVSIYGSAAGNLALKFLSLGGLYIGGGIAPKILPALQKGEFMDAFVAKGRFDSLLRGIRVQVILNEKTALLGAARYAMAKNYL